MKTKTQTESAITAAIIAELRKLRAKGHRIWWFKVRGGPMQVAGVPDLYVLCNGMPFHLEVKRPGGKATPLQAATMDAINEAGGVARVVTSAVEALEVMVETLQ